MGRSRWVRKVQFLDRFTARIRRKRFAFFLELMASVPRPIRVLDVGGTPLFWEMMGCPEGEVEITLLNVAPTGTAPEGIRVVEGDARDMAQFAAAEFDVVFSNSVIEHVGSSQEQQRMAEEVQRVGRRYFVQTPDRYCPVEPHFLVPFFQFFPIAFRVFLLRRFSVGWYPRLSSREEAEGVARSIRLLSRRELRGLFPDGSVRRERLWGMPYSLIAYGGWA